MKKFEPRSRRSSRNAKQSKAAAGTRPVSAYLCSWSTSETMLRANSEVAKPVHGAAAAAAWFPGRMKTMEGLAAATPSPRALEIAKSREELLALLHDLPESERELSFTDLVEKNSTADDSAAGRDVAASHEGEPNRGAGGEVKERRRRRSSFGGSSDGVLLNFYVPASLTRSLTAPRSSRGSFRCGSTSQSESNKRERDHTNFGCWSALWDRKRRSKSIEAADGGLKWPQSKVHS